VEKRTAPRYYQLKSGRACTPSARITDRTTTPDGATRRTISVLNRRGIICSSTVISGKTSRPSCGRGSKRQPRGRSGSGASATYWRTSGAARRCSTFCGVPTLDERLPRWRRIGIAGMRRGMRWRRTRWRRMGWRWMGWRGVRSSDPRVPDVGFCCLVLFCFLFCFVLFSCVISFDRLRYFLGSFPWSAFLS